MTVRALLENIGSREISEWMAFFKLENDRMKKAGDPKAAQAQIHTELAGYKGSHGKNRR